MDTVHECDRQTDRITIAKTVQRITSHGKNRAIIFCSFLDIWENAEWPRFFGPPCIVFNAGKDRENNNSQNVRNRKV